MTKTVKYKQGNKLRVPRSVKRAILSFFVLLFIATVAAVGYVWFTGMQEPVLKDPLAVEKVNKEAQAMKPVKVADNARVGAAVSFISIPVMPGNNAMVTVRTLPDAKCTIGVVYNGVAGTDSGLRVRTANDYGVASWTWTVPVTAPIGSWPVTITCAKNKQSAVVVTDLVVSKDGVSTNQ